MELYGKLLQVWRMRARTSNQSKLHAAEDSIGAHVRYCKAFPKSLGIHVDYAELRQCLEHGRQTCHHISNCEVEMACNMGLADIICSLKIWAEKKNRKPKTQNSAWLL